MYEEGVSDSGKLRRESIIEYVKRHPECDKESVVDYCTKIGVGSKVTVLNSIKVLELDGILKVEKEKQNSKSYKLIVVSENLLITIPQNLNEIVTNFKKFVNIVDEIYKKEFKEKYSYLDPVIVDDKLYREIIESIPSLPYNLIEIINDIFIFSFTFILTKKIDDQKYISKLYSIYFENLLKMYSYTAEKLQDSISSLDRSSLENSIVYQNYMNSQNKSNFGKVCEAVRICDILDIKDSIYGVLNLLWIKNIDSAFLSYDLIHIPQFKETCRTQFNRPYDSIVSDKDKLNIIHDGINVFILYELGTRA